MATLRFEASARPNLAVLGIGVTVVAMIATVALAAFYHQWIGFLGGAVAAGALAFIGHVMRTRSLLAAATDVLRSRLAGESQLLAEAEKSAAPLRSAMQLFDVAMPAGLAYVDAGAIVRYHNRAYARCIGLPASAIDGRPIEQVLGRTVHAEIAPKLGEALAGHDVRYERTQQTARGAARLSVQYLPHFDGIGKVAGVFAILSDVTCAQDLDAAAAPPRVAGDALPEAAARLVAALERGEFRLFSQSIVPLGDAGNGASFCEVLLRLKEEEENLLPPGSFLPVAEEHGLLPAIDRWVVSNVLDVAQSRGAGSDCVYFVNLCAPTVAEGGLAAFVRSELASRGLDGRIVCFEFPEADVVAQTAAYRAFITELGGSGCRFAVSGVGNDPASVRFLKELGAHYLKLDGAMALNVLRDSGELTRQKALNDATHSAGMQVVAQCVEDERIRMALRAIGTDFAQGFGISMPGPMVAAKKPGTMRLAANDSRAAAA